MLPDQYRIGISDGGFFDRDNLTAKNNPQVSGGMDHRLRFLIAQDTRMDLLHPFPTKAGASE